MQSRMATDHDAGRSDYQDCENVQQARSNAAVLFIGSTIVRSCNENDSVRVVVMKKSAAMIHAMKVFRAMRVRAVAREADEKKGGRILLPCRPVVANRGFERCATARTASSRHARNRHSGKATKSSSSDSSDGEPGEADHFGPLIVLPSSFVPAPSVLDVRHIQFSNSTASLDCNYAIQCIRSSATFARNNRCSTRMMTSLPRGPHARFVSRTMLAGGVQ
ncbi:hypothetical protein [Jeongeupia sp. HS-3]|uniref:hypothetical protein n=1 Tax=Jeongeupia sp. HS-3 TaxID=1009682 RepID=UPI001910E476|nr:hypothetical protein [Jeongeupia sp. HS-3]